jgi:hypothetical protein
VGENIKPAIPGDDAIPGDAMFANASYDGDNEEYIGLATP